MSWSPLLAFRRQWAADGRVHGHSLLCRLLEPTPFLISDLRFQNFSVSAFQSFSFFVSSLGLRFRAALSSLTHSKARPGSAKSSQGEMEPFMGFSVLECFIFKSVFAVAISNPRANVPYMRPTPEILNRASQNNRKSL